ncbi:MAG: hypothetical protein HC898_03225 [Phycisphaerales bacterium]|nr:hypothetical protein [Phycisphaerales bacterium]
MIYGILAQAGHTPPSRMIELLIIVTLAAVVLLLVLAFRDVLKLLSQLTRQVQNLTEQIAGLEHRQAGEQDTTYEQPHTPVTSAATSAGVPAQPAGTGGMPPQLIAVIAAAATAALGGAGKQVVVKRITTRKAITAPSAWAEMGRVVVHSSHNIRRG